MPWPQICEYEKVWTASTEVKNVCLKVFRRVDHAYARRGWEKGRIKWWGNGQEGGYGFAGWWHYGIGPIATL